MLCASLFDPVVGILVVCLTSFPCNLGWLYVKDQKKYALWFSIEILFTLCHFLTIYSWLNGKSDAEEHFCGGEEQIWDSHWNIKEGEDHHRSRGSSCCFSLCTGHKNSQREVSFCFTLLVFIRFFLLNIFLVYIL